MHVRLNGGPTIRDACGTSVVSHPLRGGYSYPSRDPRGLRGHYELLHRVRRGGVTVGRMATQPADVDMSGYDPGAVRSYLRRAARAIPFARSRLDRMSRAIGRLLVAWLVGGSVVRLTVRDGWSAAAVLYYASPPEVLAGIALLLALARWRSPRYRPACLAVGLIWTAVALKAGVRAEDVTAPPSSTAPLIRFCYWNISGAPRGWKRVASRVRRWKDDVVLLTEALDTPSRSRSAHAARFPGYRLLPIGQELLLLTRNARVAAVESVALDAGGSAEVLDIGVRGVTFRFIAVDLGCNPLRSRRADFDKLGALMSRQPVGLPVVVAGDFNTPSDSVLFGPFNQGWTSAFDTAGEGWGRSWPVVCPVLDLDQAWGSPHVRWEACDLSSSTLSDHRSLRAKFWVAPTEAPSDG